MKSIVFIHVDALRREFSAAWMFAKRLEEQGFAVFLTSRSTTNYLLKFVVPDLLVLSHPFTISQENLAKLKLKGTKIIVTEVEGIVRVDHDIGTTYPDFVDFENFETIYVWNEWSRKWLYKNRDTKECRIKVSGCLRNDLIKSIDIKKDKKRIGILGRYELINPFDGRHNFENLRLMEKRHIERWHVDLDSFLIVRDLTAYLTQNGYKVSFRPHPNENVKAYNILKNFFGENFEVNEDFDYYAWLETLEKVVGTVSSAFLEPYFAKIPIICIDSLFEYRGPPNLEEWRKVTREASYNPSSQKDLYSLCLREDLVPKKSKRLDEYLYDLYSIKEKENSNAVDFVVNDVLGNINNLRKSSMFKLVIVLILKKLLDILVILRCIIENSGAWSLQNLKQYDFNPFFHRPNEFMIRSFEKNKKRNRTR
ncbi:hypothetical protein P3G55_09625 [Leptospira sp. 96542]|nr:hypothetical protein [Leptospira sp. 96542]